MPDEDVISEEARSGEEEETDRDAEPSVARPSSQKRAQMPPNEFHLDIRAPDLTQYLLKELRQIG
jgi:hypothetical protein